MIEVFRDQLGIDFLELRLRRSGRHTPRRADGAQRLGDLVVLGVAEFNEASPVRLPVDLALASASSSCGWVIRPHPTRISPIFLRDRAMRKRKTEPKCRTSADKPPRPNRAGERMVATPQGFRSRFPDPTIHMP